MMRKLMLAVIPMAALAGVVRADEVDGLNDFGSTSSFEVDALTAALTGDELAGDAEVLARAGSEATEDVDAEGVCFYGGYGYGGFGYGGYGYYRNFHNGYGWGQGCYNTFNYYRVYRPVYHCYTPVYSYYSNYCW